MAAPFEVVAGPLSVYVAPLSTAFPATNAAPGGSWTLLGTSGTKNYDEPGVVVTNNQTLNPWRAAGGTAAKKVFRSAEELLFDFTLVDLTLEQYAKVMNNVSVSTQAGPPATKTINLLQGTTVALYALLARGVSPYNDTLTMQFQVAMCYQAASPKPSFQKDKPAGLACQFYAMDDGSATPWQLVAQTA